MMINITHFEYSLLCIIFYLIGSIPSAYLILRFRTGEDITKSGSGNVGALNSYEVSRSRLVGILVLIADFLKGFLPSFLLYVVFGFPISFLILPLGFLIAGHNFSVWLKFRGGRGLATAAGISAGVNIWLLIIWCTVFLVVYAVRRNIHLGNIIATVLMPVFLVFLKDFINMTYASFSENFSDFFVLTVIISLLILIKHIKPLVDLIRNPK